MSDSAISKRIRDRWDRNRVAFEVQGPTMTKGSFAAQCDINNIMAKYKRSGLVAHLASSPGRYENLPDSQDYHASMNQVIATQALFRELPANLRERFGNDPAGLLVFLENPENRDEAVSLGLIAKQAPSAPVEAAEGAEKAKKKVAKPS